MAPAPGKRQRGAARPRSGVGDRRRCGRRQGRRPMLPRHRLRRRRGAGSGASPPDGCFWPSAVCGLTAAVSAAVRRGSLAGRAWPCDAAGGPGAGTCEIDAGGVRLVAAAGRDRCAIGRRWRMGRPIRSAVPRMASTGAVMIPNRCPAGSAAARSRSAAGGADQRKAHNQQRSATHERPPAAPVSRLNDKCCTDTTAQPLPGSLRC